jgi:hypothetical protein
MSISVKTKTSIQFEYFYYYLDELRKASWNGIPKQYRAKAWKLLCVCSTSFFYSLDNLFQGYLPAIVERRDDTLTRKRDEYWSYVRQYYHTRTESEHQDTFRQVFEIIFNEVPVERIGVSIISICNYSLFRFI